MVRKNKNYLGIADDVERTPLRLVHFRENYDDSDYKLSPARMVSGGGYEETARFRGGVEGPHFPGDDFVRELKARSEGYNIKMARHEKKAREIERVLGEAGDHEVKKEFGKQIDGERLEKEQVVALLGRLRDEQVRKEVKTEGQKRTLEGQLEQASKELEVLANERTLVQGTAEEMEGVMKEKVEELEKALKETQQEGRVKNEEIRAKLLS